MSVKEAAADAAAVYVLTHQAAGTVSPGYDLAVGVAIYDAAVVVVANQAANIADIAGVAGVAGLAVDPAPSIGIFDAAVVGVVANQAANPLPCAFGVSFGIAGLDGAAIV